MNINQKGFSLVEVLIAITLLAVGLLGVAGMQTTAISGNSFAQSGTIAIQMAEEMVDRIRANAGNNPQVYHGIDTSAGCGGITGPAAADCAQWLTALQSSSLVNPRGRVTVATDQPMENTATISVTVNWGSGSGSRNITINTILETWGT